MARAKPPQKTDWVEGMVYLYQFPRCTCVPNPSHYSLKVETWLRMNNINYTVIEGFKSKSSEATYPFVEYNGKEYPDSSIIVRELTEIFGKQSLDAHLTSEQKGHARALAIMCEDNLVKATAALRFGDHIDQFMSADNWAKPQPWVFNVLRPLIKNRMQSGVKKSLQFHGIGKHTHDEIVNIAVEDIRALARALGSKQYFSGDKPTSVDCTIFGTLAQCYYFTWEWPPRSMLQSVECENLRNYCARMKQKFWPDWDEICRKQTKQ